MTKQAKIKMGLDIKPMKDSLSEAKKALEDLGNVKLDKEIKKAFKREIYQEATQQVGVYKSMLSAATKELEGMATSGEKAWDHSRAVKLIAAIREYKGELEAVRRIQNSGSLMGRMTGGSGGGGMGMPSLPGKGMLGALGVSVGVGAAVSRAMRQADQSLQLRSVTGGNTLMGGSQYGFNREERRGRAIGVARGLGRNISEPDLARTTDLGEALERAFGIQGGEFGAAVGASRKAGARDETKFLASAIGDAVGAGMSGSAVGEYLASMTTYLSEMSTGVNIQTDSLSGFAGALGQMDFFKTNPERIFDTLRTLGKTFQGGNDFQQYLTYRSFQGAAGLGNERDAMSGQMVRQNLGLFAQSSPEMIERFKKRGMGGLSKSLAVGGEDIVNQMLMRAVNDSMGAEGSEGLAFQEITGLKGGAGMEIFDYLLQQKEGGGMTGLSKNLMKKVKNSMKSPEEIARENMENLDGSLKDLDKRLNDLQDAMSDFAAKGVSEFVKAVDEFASLVGIEDDLKKLVALLAAGGLITAAGNAAAGGGGANVVSGGSKGLGNLLVKSLGAAAAFSIGQSIGEGMRKSLNEWTEGEWNKKVQDMWQTGLESVGIDIAGEGKIKKANIVKKNAVEWNEQAGKKLSIGELNERAEIYMRKQEDNYGLPPTPDQIQEEIDRNSQGFWEWFKRGDADENDGGSYQNGGKIGAFKKGSLKSVAEGTFGRRKKKKDDGFWNKVFAVGSPAERGRATRKAMGKQFGGPIDGVNIRATQGEFIVNAQDSARNYGALVHANDGGLIQPVGGGGGFPESAMPSMPTGDFNASDPENTAATNANTQALMALIQAMKSGGGGGFSAYPRGAGGRLGIG